MKQRAERRWCSISIWAPHLTSFQLAHRIRFSNHVVAADHVISHAPYSNLAYVPEGWTLGSRHHCDDLRVKRPRSLAETVGVLPVVSTANEDAYSKSFASALWAKAAGNLDYDAEISELTVQELRRWFVDCEVLRRHGIAEDPPNSRSVSTDRRTGSFIGLHVDSWDGLPLNRRSESNIRLSLNLGPTARHFMFVGLQVQELIDAVMLRTGHRPNTRELVRAFFNLFPTYPVIRLTVLPGEAYLAASDNLIHDASSEGEKSTRHLGIRCRVGPLRADTVG